MGSAGIPGFSWIANYRAEQMEYDENRRYWSDFAKNTGVDIDDWKYPIRMGRYGNVSSLGASLNVANKGIMNLYREATYKPPVHTHYHYMNNYNYGDYYRYGDFNNYQNYRG